MESGIVPVVSILLDLVGKVWNRLPRQLCTNIRDAPANESNRRHDLVGILG